MTAAKRELLTSWRRWQDKDRFAIPLGTLSECRQRTIRSPPSAAQAPQSEASRVAELPPTEVAAKPLIEGFDAGLLDAYRLALIDAAKRYKRYPGQAMERGWQGRVEIRVVVGADGMTRRAHVKTSSNYQILDDQALDMVKRGKPLTQVPPALRGREFTVDVPVIFELQTG